MNSRIEELCAYVRPSKVFADVGCDHGYCTQIALSRGLCGKAVITDISADSLKKAETLLKRYIDEGKCRSYCTDGLNGIQEKCDELLIAGMGGKEIIHILENSYIPERFILQPMKNSPDLRRFLISNGCFIERDYTAFFDDKFYDIIVGTNSCASEKNSAYKQVEFEFGRDNLVIGDERFTRHIESQLEISSSALERAKTRETVLRLERVKSILLQALEMIKGNKTKMKAIDIFKELDECFPVAVSDSACERFGYYDNSGYLVETEDEITGIVVSLDLSKKAIERAKELGYNLIITHHPCIYSPIKKLSAENHAVNAAKSGIAVISMHLNMDFALGGVCDSLTELCGGVYEGNPTPLESVEGGAYGKVAYVEECTLEEFAEKVKKALGARAVRVYNNNANVKKILCLCGAGLDEKAAFYAKQVGADVIVTSEAKHHIISILKDENISLVELTHYASEWEPFKKALQREFIKKISLPFEFVEEEDLL